MPPVPGCFSTSPVHLGLDFLPTGTTGSFDSLVGCRSLIEQEPDLSCLSPPLVPLPDNLLLLPMSTDAPRQLPVCQSLAESLASAVSSPLDLSWESLISDGLPGWPY